MAEFKVPHIIPNTRRTPRSQTNITEVAEDQHTVESSRDGKRIERPGEQSVKRFACLILEIIRVSVV